MKIVNIDIEIYEEEKHTEEIIKELKQSLRKLDLNINIDRITAASPENKKMEIHNFIWMQGKGSLM